MKIKFKNLHISIKLITIGLSAYILSNILENIINIDFLNYSSKEYLIFKVVHTLGSIGLTLTLFCCIFFGIRKVKINRQDAFGKKLTISGIILFLILFLSSIIGYKLMAKTRNIIGTDKDIKRIEKMLNTPDLSPERKQKLSYFLAIETFVQEGKLINFFNENGKLQLYKATEKDNRVSP